MGDSNASQMLGLIQSHGPDAIAEFARKRFQESFVGAQVEIIGLAQKPELNGTRAVVKRFIKKSGRYEVDPTGDQKTIALKLKNLRVMRIVKQQT